MNDKKTLAVLSLALCVLSAHGSGFGLYQPSAVSHAMGGALVGKAMDASANFNNPATLTDLTNITVNVGFVTEHPRGRVDVRRDGGPWREETMNSGLFWLPHLQLAVPLPADFTFGLGFSAEYGLGTKYDNGWPMEWSSQETTIQGLVINPNIAYKITDDWSVGVGLRWLYFDFEQYSTPIVSKTLGPEAGQYAGTYELGRFDNHLKGDNEWKSVGWQIGTKYDITKTISVGAVYKSAIDVTVKGKTSNRVLRYNDSGISSVAVPSGLSSLKSDVQSGKLPASYAQNPAVQQKYVSAADKVIRQTVAQSARDRCGSAEADLTLPQSITFGANWDVFDTWHLGAAVSWTEWSEFDTLHFDLQGGDKDTQLAWRDTWRGSIGSCWDFWEGWKWMVSYTYDMDSTTSDQESAMLPPADRHILATGITWNFWGNFDLTVSYACIFMCGRDMRSWDALGRRYDLETDWGYCHAGGCSLSYRF